MMNIFSALFKDIADRRRVRQFEAFRQFMATYEESKRWVAFPCPMCQKPATAPDAHFCAYCGASMAPTRIQAGLQALSNIGGIVARPESSTYYPSPIQQMPPIERPLLAYLEREDQEKMRNTGPQTKIHRAVHLKKVTHP